MLISFCSPVNALYGENLKILSFSITSIEFLTRPLSFNCFHNTFTDKYARRFFYSFQTRHYINLAQIKLIFSKQQINTYEI